MHLLTTAFDRTKLTDGIESSDPPPWGSAFHAMSTVPRRSHKPSHDVDRVRPTGGCRLRVFFYKQLLARSRWAEQNTPFAGAVRA
jgi:hypothetical protein